MAKIIITEDDPMISEIYQKKFEEAGFGVLVADSGEQALALAKEGSADVLLLDLLIPKMDGFRVIENLKKGGYNPKLKIIILSNLSQKENQEKAIKLGADGFIIKADHTPSSIIKEVERILNESEEEKKNEEIQTERKVGQPADKKRILLIEDEKVFVEMFGEKLRQDGYEVVTAENGAWGLKEAFKKPFDLFIIDVVMPAVTGDEIIQKLKLEDNTKNVPIIVLSASVEPAMEKKMLGMGADAFFVKTKIIPSELSNKVGQILKGV